MRPLWTGKGTPNFENRHFWGSLSMPMFCQLTNSTMDELIYQQTFITMHDPANEDLRLEIINALT